MVIRAIAVRPLILLVSPSCLAHPLYRQVRGPTAFPGHPAGKGLTSAASSEASGYNLGDGVDGMTRIKGTEHPPRRISPSLNQPHSEIANAAVLESAKPTGIQIKHQRRSVTMLKSYFVIAVACITLAVIYGRSLHHRAKRWEELPNVTFHFDCKGRATGFYADLEFGCMIFHICDEDGRRIPYVCGGNGTGFNQQYRICDWQSNFDCAQSENFYYLNDLTYVTDPPRFDNNIQ